MTRDDNESNTGSLSFLDVIACAFGAIVLLVIILPIGDMGQLGNDPELSERYSGLQFQSDQLDAEIQTIEEELAQVRSLLRRLETESDAASAENQQLIASIDELRQESERLQARKAIVEQTHSEVLDQDPNAALETEYSGLPVDAEYVAFVIDTSGSMKSPWVWSRLIREFDAILEIYPQVKGFQVLNDQGKYLFSDYRGRWIRDSPTLRNLAKLKLSNWRAYSESNPAPGIYTAIQDLYEEDKRMAVFVFGDDYATSEFGDFIDRIDRVVTNRSVSEGTLRIHGVAYRNVFGTASQLNYATLMRELSLRYDGAFLAMP